MGWLTMRERQREEQVVWTSEMIILALLLLLMLVGCSPRTNTRLHHQLDKALVAVKSKAVTKQEGTACAAYTFSAGCFAVSVPTTLAFK